MPIETRKSRKEVSCQIAIMVAEEGLLFDVKTFFLLYLVVKCMFLDGNTTNKNDSVPVKITMDAKQNLIYIFCTYTVQVHVIYIVGFMLWTCQISCCRSFSSRRHKWLQRGPLRTVFTRGSEWFNVLFTWGSCFNYKIWRSTDAKSSIQGPMWIVSVTVLSSGPRLRKNWYQLQTNGIHVTLFQMYAVLYSMIFFVFAENNNYVHVHKR